MFGTIGFNHVDNIRRYLTNSTAKAIGELFNTFNHNCHLLINRKKKQNIWNKKRTKPKIFLKYKKNSLIFFVKIVIFFQYGFYYLK